MRINIVMNIQQLAAWIATLVTSCLFNVVKTIDPLVYFSIHINIQELDILATVYSFTFNLYLIPSYIDRLIYSISINIQQLTG